MLPKADDPGVGGGGCGGAAGMSPILQKMSPVDGARRAGPESARWRQWKDFLYGQQIKGELGWRGGGGWGWGWGGTEAFREEAPLSSAKIL